MIILTFTTLEFLTGGAMAAGSIGTLFSALVHMRINNIKDKSDTIEQQVEKLWEAVHETRENYLLEKKFDLFADRLFKKLDHIEESLDKKVSKSECQILREIERKKSG